MCQIWVSSGEWEELILSAVRANGSALQYASQRLRNDQEVGVPRNCCSYAGMSQIYQPFSTHQLEGFTIRCYFKHMFILNIYLNRTNFVGPFTHWQPMAGPIYDLGGTDWAKTLTVWRFVTLERYGKVHAQQAPSVCFCGDAGWGWGRAWSSRPATW